jgi:protein-tyrosine phosphatase
METRNTTFTRHFPLEGVYNVRDLGGYPTLDGRTTRPGRFLRSDNIGKLSEAASKKLVDWGIKTIIDLRFDWETATFTHCFSSHECVKYLNVSLINKDVVPGLDKWTTQDKAYIAILEGGKVEFRQVMETLADPQNLPALFHCHAGKDRTGLIAALLLSLAKVPAETIAEDYAITRQYIAPLLEKWREEVIQAGRDLAKFNLDNACDPNTMFNTLKHLDQKYGGAEGYLRDTGMSQASLDNLKASLVE